jgi:hypothetical protein
MANQLTKSGPSLAFWTSDQKQQDAGYPNISTLNGELGWESLMLIYDQILIYIKAYFFRYHTRIYFIRPTLKSKAGVQSEQPYREYLVQKKVIIPEQTTGDRHGRSQIQHFCFSGGS